MRPSRLRAISRPASPRLQAVPAGKAKARSLYRRCASSRGYRVPAWGSRNRMERIPIPSWESIVFHTPSRFQDGAGTMRLPIRFHSAIDAVPLLEFFQRHDFILPACFRLVNPAFRCPVRWVKRALARYSTFYVTPFRHVVADRISTSRSALRPAEGHTGHYPVVGLRA